MPITLNNVRLVNWHIFSDVNIRIGETTLFAGDNGSGKSTIIDAIQYALVADLSRIKFNSAASDRRTGRTLDSYCRGKIGAEGLDTIRSSDAVTHVMLEFSGADYFCAGIMIESFQDGSRPSETPWILPDARASEIMVKDDKRAMTPRAFRERIKSADGSVFSSKREYQKELTLKLGVFRKNAEFNPYLETFVRAVSFVPLNSVDQFVSNYILDEKTLDISDMKQNLENYRVAEREALGVKTRIERLSNIDEKISEYAKIQRQIGMKRYLKLRVESEIAGARAEKNDKDILSARTEFDANESEIYTAEKEERRLILLTEECQTALAKNDAHILYRSLTANIEECTRGKNEQKARLDRIELLAAQCKAVLGREISSDADVEIKAVESERTSLVEKRMSDSASLAGSESEVSSHRTELAELKKGLLRYPESVSAIRKALTDAGIANYVFADLIECADEKWQNAAEGWLNTQRFSVLVHDDDFQKAIEVYRSLPRSVSGVGIPNLRKMRGTKPHDASLFTVIRAQSPLAECYAAYVLGDVIMADIDTLKNYPKAVTSDCMKYASHTASRIKEEAYSRWYIGKIARERRIDYLENEIKRLDAAISDLRNNIAYASEREMLLQNAVHSLLEIRSLSDAQSRYDAIESELAALEEKRKAIDVSSFENLERELSALKIRAAEIREEQNLRIKKKGKIEERLASFESQREHLLAAAAEASRSFESFSRELSGIEDYTAYYDERVRESDRESILRNYDSSLQSSLTRRDSVVRDISDLTVRYNADFNEFLPDHAEESDDVAVLLRKYTDTELPAYMEKITRARKDAEKQFASDFVSRLSENMQSAKERITEINQTLKNISFGRDRYRFHAEERAEKRMEINVIKKAAEISQNEDTLFASLSTDEEKKTVQNLFDTILSKELSSPEVEAICDYRRYFQYDIKMIDTTLTDKESGNERELSLSRVIREKSGGEAQTPYYVAIAASFLRFFRKGEETIRLALFDEAFNKMDDSRIEKTIDFFKSIGIQVITAVPTEKIETIAPFMDTTNLVIRHGLSADVRSYKIVKTEPAHE
jgi:uncharacterized protein YPO0396